MTFFLRMQIINIIGRKRRKREETTFWLADLLETVDREQFDINHDGDSQSGTTSWLLRLLTDTDQGQPAPEVDSCLRRTWRCVSGSVEDLLHHLDDKELSVVSVVQSVLARMVFHGAQNSMWMSVMRIPQVSCCTANMATSPVSGPVPAPVHQLSRPVRGPQRPQ